MIKQKPSVLKFFVLGIFLVLVGIYIFSFKQNQTVQIVPSPSPILNAIEGQITYAKVTRVIDGDTIVIDTGQHVRYIGMNTPEIETLECYATEASEINKNLVLGKVVKLEKDVSETDKYSRLLRYVYIDDTFVDDELIRDGSAKVETVSPDTKYKDEFLESQNYAKENKLGLWRKCP